MEVNKIVLEATNGVNLRLREEKDGVIVVQALRLVESENYKNPFIPEGFEYLTGKWDNGFVIRNKVDESWFTWIPVGALDPDGTLDGENFVERFGRRKFDDEIFEMAYYHEPINYEVWESVKKYGGFYISSCPASMEGRKLVFKKGNMPLVNINQLNSERLAKEYEKEHHQIGSCQPNGAVYDTVFKWIIQFGFKTFDEVVKDSTLWGNYSNLPNSPRQPMPTGLKENWCVCNIYDLAGNCLEWSTEMFSKSECVLRTGNCFYAGNQIPAFMRLHNCYKKYESAYTSFRAVIYIK